MTELIIINKNVWESKQRYNSYPIFPLHLPIQNILLAPNPSTAFLQKASGLGKNVFFSHFILSKLDGSFSVYHSPFIRVISFLRINSDILRLKSRNVRIRIISKRKVLITQCGKLSSMNTLCSTLSIRYFFSSFFLHLSLAHSYMTAYMLVYILW